MKPNTNKFNLRNRINNHDGGVNEKKSLEKKKKSDSQKLKLRKLTKYITKPSAYLLECTLYKCFKYIYYLLSRKTSCRTKRQPTTNSKCSVQICLVIKGDPNSQSLRLACVEGKKYINCTFT